MAYQLDKQTIEADFQALQNEHVMHYRETLLEDVRAFQQASTLEDFFEVQLRLLAQYAARQSVVEDRRAALSRESAQLRQLVRERLRPLDRIRDLQYRMDQRRQQERRDDLLSFALRELADGIAWRLLRFDRRAFAVLGDGPRVDRLALGEGFDVELEYIAEHWEQHGRLALHNDLTTSLRYGDLTVLLGADAEAGVGIQEVKAAGQRGTQAPPRDGAGLDQQRASRRCPCGADVAGPALRGRSCAALRRLACVRAPRGFPARLAQRCSDRGVQAGGAEKPGRPHHGGRPSAR